MSEPEQEEIDTEYGDIDTCHHMVGFDMDCEWCELEETEERRKVAAEHGQQELPL